MACWTQIAHNTFNAPASPVTWTGIPTDGTYDHLLIMGSVRSDRSAAYDTLRISFNDREEASDYSSTSIYVYAPATTVRTGNNTAHPIIHLGDITGGNNSPSSGNGMVFGNFKLWIPDYANTDRFKAAFVECTRESSSADEWANTLTAFMFEYQEAIDEVSLSCNVGDFVSGSEFTLIGVKGA